MIYVRSVIWLLLWYGACQGITFVDFHTGMAPSTCYYPLLAYMHTDWRLAKQQYDRYFLKERLYTEHPRIPKIIHQIWLGSPLPDYYKQLQQSWRQHHPDWQYILWTELEIEAFGLTNKAAYDAAKNLGQKSDIARYEILYRIGGLYVDTDFVCIKPFDMLHHCCDFFAGIAYGRVVSVYNGLIGAAPGHPILYNCIDRIAQTVLDDTSMLGILQSTGPLLFTQCIFDVTGDTSSRCVLFPVSYFYPLPEDQRGNENIATWIKPESFAIHYWHMAWMS